MVLPPRQRTTRRPLSSMPPPETSGLLALSPMANPWPAAPIHHNHRPRTPIPPAVNHFLSLPLRDQSSPHFRALAPSALAPLRVLLLRDTTRIHIVLTPAEVITHLHLLPQSVHYHPHQMLQVQIHQKSRTTTTANCPLQVWSHRGRFCEDWRTSQ